MNSCLTWSEEAHVPHPGPDVAGSALPVEEDGPGVAAGVERDGGRYLVRNLRVQQHGLLHVARLVGQNTLELSTFIVTTTSGLP